jgi:diguanylate cyclase (GGDEF)-like protein
MESKILLVDDDPGMIQLMARILSGLGQLRFATNGTAALQRAREVAPDLMLLDTEMPGMTGFQVCAAMKEDPALCDVPIIFVTAHSGDEFELKGLDIGAVDFIAKPISEPLLLARVRTQLRVKHLTDELRRIATIDALTDVSNRRAFDDVLAREWKRGLRACAPISLLLVDVDHFKLFNDCYGHPAGDGCLRSVAQALLGACLRPADLVARYGGEEFAMLLPVTPRAGAEHMARRMLEAVASLGIPHEASPTVQTVTVSVGVGCYDERSPCWVERAAGLLVDTPLTRTATDLVRCADQALYDAKRGGRAQAMLRDIDDVDRSLSAQAVPTDPQMSATGRLAAP